MASRDSFADKVIAAIHATIAVSVLWGCSADQNDELSDDPHFSQSETLILKPKVKAFCGDCHAYPEPHTFPKHYWAKEVASGFRFYKESGRDDLTPPRFDDVVEYYQRLAPETLIFSPNSETSRQVPIQFERSELNLPDEMLFPAVSFIRSAVVENRQQDSLWFCDMSTGLVVRTITTQQQPQLLETIKGMGFPAHIELCDLDQDGLGDLLIADLGSFMPADHQRGRVVWAKGTNSGQTYETITLAEQLGRVADVRPLDADADGDLDLIVAEFGWRATGRLLLLEHISGKQSEPHFETHILDNRHGSSHVEVCDLNGDLAQDFVVLMSQEFETVVAFVNRGDGTFHKQTLFEAGDPSYGSTGIQVVDLDGDHDLDVLYTNGDMLDSGILKPSHGIHLLENIGDMQFQPRRLTELPGAYKAIASDLDDDGDLDVVACALFVNPGFGVSSLIWLEQQPDGQFIRHNLAGSNHQFCTLGLGDYDGNGTIDIAVGNFDVKPTSDRAWLSFWWNRGTADKVSE